MVRNINDIAKLVSSAGGYREDFCAQFLTAMFKAVEEGLNDDKSVEIRGLGSFSTDGEKVLFQPDASLGDAVNAPFSFFSPEVLSDDYEDGNTPYDDPQFENEEEVALPTADNEPTETTQPVESQDLTINPQHTNDPTVVVSEEAEEAINDNEAATPQSEEADLYDDPEMDEPEIGRNASWWKILLSFVCGVIVGAAGVLTYQNLIMTKSASEETVKQTTQTDATGSVVNEPEKQEPEDTTAAASSRQQSDAAEIEQVEAPEITEEVTATNYLATMARRHYGRFEFWVYIYEENKSKLSHPDRIEPHTIVVIPPAEKYGINKNDPGSVDKALKLSEEIYSRFR